MMSSIFPQEVEKKLVNLREQPVEFSPARAGGGAYLPGHVSTIQMLKFVEGTPSRSHTLSLVTLELQLSADRNLP